MYNLLDKELPKMRKMEHERDDECINMYTVKLLKTLFESIGRTLFINGRYTLG